MKSSIIEINQDKKIRGRTYIKWVIHEIHKDTSEYNKNGITWKEQYVQNNLESVKGMPICVEFLDEWEKEEPYGHGMTDIDLKDGTALFENSVVVGAAEEGYIDTIEVNGKTRRVLIGVGYIYNQRYPKFVRWLKSKMYDGSPPETSVEISAKEGEEQIIYENGWVEKGRVPMIYDYTGDAILGIEPADDSAVLLELNQYKGDKGMEKTMIELNNKIDQLRTENNNLKDKLKEKDDKIQEVNQTLKKKQEELNATVENIKELNSKLEAKEKEVKELNEKIEKAEAELNELREYKKKAEDQKLIAELNSKLQTYSEEEKEVAKNKIEKFNNEPSKELMNEIINEINSAIAEKIIQERRKNKTSEQNSKIDDIYEDVLQTGDNDVTIDDLY